MFIKKGTICRVISDSMGFFRPGERVVALENSSTPYVVAERFYSSAKTSYMDYSDKDCCQPMCDFELLPVGVYKEPTKATRIFSDRQESHISKVTGGRVQSNSGGTKFGGGDVHTNKFFIEAKTPTKEKQSFSIKMDWLAKIKEQAFEQGKECWALAFTFDPDKQENFYVISEKEFLEYLRYKEAEK